MRYYSDEVIARDRRIIGLAMAGDQTAIQASATIIHGQADNITVTLAASICLALDPVLRGSICEAAHANPSSLTALDTALGLAYVDAAVQVRSEAGWKRRDVDGIGLQGSVVCLQSAPVELAGAFVTGVLELGDSATVAEALGVPVVSDFAASDMAAGGRGEPLEALVAELISVDAIGDESAQRAVVFGILADRTMQGLPGNLPESTGAGRAVVLGSITPGR